MKQKTVAILGTLDTKGEEFAYLRRRIESSGVGTIVIDSGVLGTPAFAADVSRDEVARAGGHAIEELVSARDRGKSIAVMAEGAAAVVRRLFGEGKIEGLISLGGTAGTSIAALAMQTLPSGFPKVIVSTVASGNTRPYVGTKDIVMLHSIVDIAGLNRLSRRILANAAAAISGMVVQDEIENGEGRPLVGATMFGVTTPCVTAARQILEQRGFEVLVFHATGTGGQALEELVDDDYFAGVLDITTTELADELAGGVLSAGPHRLEAAARNGVPQVVCPGAIDMVNFGPLDSVPERYKHRKLYVHNPNVTLMRTTPEECAALGRITAEKLNLSRGSVHVLIPLRGFSAIDSPGQPFYWPEADRSYLEALKNRLASKIQLIEIDAHINDEIFAREAANTLLEAIKKTESHRLERTPEARRAFR
ncbi:conserved hypothetical protein [Candidatus Sulfotelmatomonas gaucii]|uniref:Uncharacterized protein n=1 Tax=Candidatus Sulfuritelmatomonas gaucii TaxID=2043161 RepID=A0A2N9LCM4_9BACT|nr:conserved hypothetical protein [Candidatus Sulfotelmatomonas gaucii]